MGGASRLVATGLSRGSGLANGHAGGSAGFLEICVDSLAGARAAIAGGADQIELCAALAVGGLTPSAGLAEAVVALARPAQVRVRAMVRPQAGGFDLDADTLDVAMAEARALVALGCDGLVFGATRAGEVDGAAVRAWRDAIGPVVGLTFHRAVDTLADPVAAVERIVALGFDQILTSGGVTSAPAGAATIAAMTRRAAGRCRIVAGAGVRPGNVATLVAAAGTRAIHASARAEGSSPPVTDPFGFGAATPPADAATVRALRRAVDDASL